MADIKVQPVPSKTLTPEEISQLRPVDAPVLYASQFRISITSTDAMILFQRVHPSLLGNEYTDAAKVEPTAIMHMSLHALKDLHLLISGIVAQVEKDYGPLVTDFSRKRETEKK